jgi:hypothetical protein
MTVMKNLKQHIIIHNITITKADLGFLSLSFPSLGKVGNFLQVILTLFIPYMINELAFHDTIMWNYDISVCRKYIIYIYIHHSRIC